MTRRFAIQFTPAARDDLKTLSLYLATSASRDVAEDFLNEIDMRIDALSLFPMRGSIPRELELFDVFDHRQIVVGKIRIFYNVDGNTVSIVLVADGRRDIQALLRNRLLTPPDLPR